MNIRALKQLVIELYPLIIAIFLGVFAYSSLKCWELEKNATALTIFGAAISFLGSIIVTQHVHKKSFPKLEINAALIPQRNPDSTDEYTWEFANIMVKNADSERTPYSFWSGKIPRIPAYDCQVTYAFYDPKDQVNLIKFNTVSGEGTFQARWGKSPQPESSPLAGMFQNPTIYAGSCEQFNVIQKSKDASVFSPCCNDYFTDKKAPTSNDFQKKTKDGEYVVKVTATCSGFSVSKDFVIQISKTKEILWKEA